MNTMISGRIGQPVALAGNSIHGVGRTRATGHPFSRRSGCALQRVPTHRRCRCRPGPHSGSLKLPGTSAETRDSDDARPSPGLGRKSGRRFTADQDPRIEESVSQLTHAQPVARFLGVRVARCSEFWFPVVWRSAQFTCEHSGPCRTCQSAGTALRPVPGDFETG